MVKHLLLLILLSVFSRTILLAHDACNFYDFGTIYLKHHFALVYNYSYFNTYNLSEERPTFSMTNGSIPFGKVGHEPEENDLIVEKTNSDYESYLSVELRGGFIIKDDWIVQFIIPYRQNTVYYERMYSSYFQPVHDTLMSLKGFGDPIVMIDRLIQKNGNNFRHIFRPGFGVKLPLGKSNFDREYDAVLLPANGSTDLIFKMNYQIMYAKKVGLNLISNHRVNGKGKANYRVGNSSNLSCDLFYIQSFKEVTIIPQVGYLFEFKNRDTNDEVRVNLSGGESQFMIIGLGFNYKNWTLNNAVQLPIIQNMEGNQIRNTGRLNSSLLFNF